MTTITDPTRLEVLRNALEGIGDGMATTVWRTARSSVVRSGLDFSCGVLSAEGELIGQGFCLPPHLGGMTPALKAVLERYRGRIYPGDVFANNDPYDGGSHLPDIFLYKPVFAGDKLLAFMCVMTHHTDIGGRIAGGNACDNTEIYQEGLRIPPLKLYQRGEPNEALWRIFEKNVRVPELVVGDLISNVTALNAGERELLRLVERSGVEEYLGTVEELLDYTERLTRAALRAMPDGEWSFTDYIDDDGFSPDPIAIVAHLSKRDDEVRVDFSGTSPQCKGSINPMLATVRGMVSAVLKSVLGTLGYDIPNTGGYFRPLRVTAPEGCFVNPRPPAPCAARAMSLMRVSQVVFGAFAQALPDKVYAAFGGCELGLAMAGYDKSKRPWKGWVQTEFYNEQAVGGFAHRDGADAQCAGMVNMANIPAEQLEAEQPLRILQYGMVADTEGAGMHRGGLGMVREYEYRMDDTTVQVRADRMKFTPYGLYGGQPSAPTCITFLRGGKQESMPAKLLVTVNTGDRLRFIWPGAGGWGEPLERDPDRVLEDVIAEKVSLERAREAYGVVIDAEARQVDTQATRALRQRRRRERLQAKE